MATHASLLLSVRFFPRQEEHHDQADFRRKTAQGLVDVAVNAINGLKSAQQEIADLKASDAADDAAQIQSVLDSVSEKIDAATAALTENPEVPVEPEPTDPEPPVEEDDQEPVQPDTVTDTSE